MSSATDNLRPSPFLAVVVIALALLGWFVLPGENEMALAIGAVVGLATGRWFGPVGQRQPFRVAAVLAVVLIVAGLLLQHVIAVEGSYTGFGTATLPVNALSHALAGLFYGLAARLVLLSLLRVQGVEETKS